MTSIERPTFYTSQPTLAANMWAAIVAGTDGATYGVNGREYVGTHGYVVAYGAPATAVIPFADITPADVAGFIGAHFHDAVRRGDYFGFWIDGGNVYLDVVEIERDRESAIVKGIRRNQIAVFDLANGVDVATGGTGK